MNRESFVKKLHQRIPARWDMSLICILTVASGILVSKGILYLGLDHPMYRYALAVLASYAIFFMLIYIWLRMHFDIEQPIPNEKSRTEKALDAIDLADGANTLLKGSTDKSISFVPWQGHGGQFSGGGASNSWDSKYNKERSSSVTDFIGPGIGDLDSEEVAVIVGVLALLAVVFGSAGYLIYQAPEILFEAAFEAVLAAGLVGNAKKMQSEGWQFSIFKKTWWLCGLMLALAMIFGSMIKNACPEAASFKQYRELCWEKPKK